jgi:hypothetical protein
MLEPYYTIIRKGTPLPTDPQGSDHASRPNPAGTRSRMWGAPGLLVAPFQGYQVTGARRYRLAAAIARPTNPAPAAL